MYSAFISRFLFILITLLPFHQALAHPHSWIDTVTTVEGNKEAITGFSMRWTFDPMTTAYLFDGEDLSPENEDKTLEKLSNEIISNMLSSYYFTYLYDKKSNSPVRYKKVTHAKLTRARGKATLTFDLELAHPFNYDNGGLSLRIFDPTYYVDLAWTEKSYLVLSNSVSKNCSVQLVEPNPTPEQVAYALAIPADADPDDTLGQLFTQTGDISCHPSSGS